MTDIALRWDIFAADFAVEANDLATDDGLQTAIILSLFTDRRADDSDALPDGQTDRRGWWGDAFPTVQGDKIGSRLWLLGREKQMQEVVTRAEEYVREALQWLLDDKVADRVDGTAEITRPGMLGITVKVYRPATDAVQWRFDYTWAAQAAQVA